MSKVYLGPSYLRQIFYDSLNENVVFDMSYVSINDFINGFKKEAEYKETENKIKSLKLDKFSKAIEDDDFILEVIKAKDELVKYKVSNIKVDKELQMILDAIDITYDFNYEDDYSNYYILDVGYDLFVENVINELINRGANKYSFNSYDNKQYIARTTNSRQAIETAIQDIINKNYSLNDCAIVVCDSLKINLYKSTLYRYNIPYIFDGETNINSIKFINMIEYFIHKDLKSYLKLVNSNININSNRAINDYLLIHSNDYRSFNKFEDDYDYFKNIENKAELIRQENEDIVNNLDNCNSLLEAFDYAYSLLEENDEKQAIKELLSSYYSKDINLENFESIKKEILNLKVFNRYEESLLISPLNNAVYNKKYLYVLDATSTNFPNFVYFDGVIKEEDLLNTGYPSLSIRRDNYLKSLTYLDKSLVTTYIVPEVTYDGKSVDASLSIKAELINLPLLENEKYKTNNHIIDKDIIKNTLIKDSTIKGSISSFEKYQSCPFAYYCRYVLGIKKEDDKSINAATIGTLFHKVLETLIVDKNKDYINYDEDDIESIIHEDFELLKKHYPNQELMINLTKKNFIEALMIEKRFLTIMESESKFNSFECEKMFNNIYFKMDDINIKLNGFIDRVDIYGNDFRVLDYKSSKKDLSLKEASKGLKLQLFTYAYVYGLDNNMNPTGVYYVKLNTSKESNKFYKYTKTKGVEEISLDESQEYIKNQRLSGVTFGDIDSLYIAKSSIKGSKLDFDLVKAGLNEIYKIIVSNILDGKFMDMPVDKACEYCDYKAICHHSSKDTYDRDIIFDFKDIK